MARVVRAKCSGPVYDSDKKQANTCLPCGPTNVHHNRLAPHFGELNFVDRKKDANVLQIASKLTVSEETSSLMLL
jgi:hypothetical protein